MQITTNQAALIALANSLNIGDEYTRLSRNPDAAVRAEFKAQREIPGTYAWAVFKCGSIMNRTVCDEECAALTAALEAR
jgi:hypothetical protein